MVDWRTASSANSAEAVKAFLRQYPQGRYTAQAADLSDELDWMGAENSSTVPGYQAYLLVHPAGRYAELASIRIDELDWRTAVAQNSQSAYESYLSRHSDGAFVDQAQDRLEELPWEVATQGDSYLAYRAYLDAYPAGRYAEEAQARLLSSRGPIPGATYTGSSSGGGSISFTVSPDGKRLSQIELVNIIGRSCTSRLLSSSGGAAITGTEFTYLAYGVRFLGTFERDRRVQGTIQAPAGVAVAAGSIVISLDRQQVLIEGSVQASNVGSTACDYSPQTWSAVARTS